MENRQFKILSTALLEEYSQQVSKSLLKNFENFTDSELSIDTFSFYTSVSAVYSSKIEGENIELDSYIKHKRFGTEFLPDYTRKTDDLYNAYQFAKQAKCHQSNLKKAHQLLTKHILPEARQGNLRTGNMYVTTSDGKIEYVASPPFTIQNELQKLYADLDTLLNLNLSINEVFFFASLLHLVYVKIHAFDDGNGRISRLLEKWFLAEKLGVKAWFIQSEKNYYMHHQTYYKNLRLLGLEYELLDYTKAMPFLLMLPQSLTTNETN
ncbi:MAG: Fic family protein [Ginsengibacter sp.]